MTFMYKLKPASMSKEQYEKELEEFNGNEFERNLVRRQELINFFSTGRKNV